MKENEKTKHNHHEEHEGCHINGHHHEHAAWWQQLIALLVAVGLIGLVLIFNPESGRIEQLLSSGISYPAVFGFGMLAAASHCVMLVGAIMLTAQTWYLEQGKKRWQILASFHAGRVAAYVAGGMILGMMGEWLQINEFIGFVFTLVAGVAMLVFGLDFLGIWCWHHELEQYFGKLRQHWKPNLWWLTLIAAATFFIPCGFTSTMQVLALQSGSAITGGLLMLAFVAGTIIPLTAVALTGSLWRGEKKWQQWLKLIVGWLIILLALLTVNESLEEIGLPHLEIIGHEHG